MDDDLKTLFAVLLMLVTIAVGVILTTYVVHSKFNEFMANCLPSRTAIECSKAWNGIVRD